MKKSVKVRVISLIIATIVLSSAVAIAAINGSPYETLKNATLDAFTYQNATVEGSMTITVNGVPAESEKVYSVISEEASMDIQFDSDGNQSYFTYTTGNLTISPRFTAPDGVEWYSAYVRPKYNNYNPGFFPGGGLTAEERNSSQVRFFELLADVLIGDLKNNITMSSENGIRSIRGTLTESQIPELAKAGIDVIVEQSSNYYASREISFDGVNFVTEQIRINKGIKTATVFKQLVRPMSAEEAEAWENGDWYSKFGSTNNNYGVTYVNGAYYANSVSREFVNEYTAAVTQEDFEDIDQLDPGAYYVNLGPREFVNEYTSAVTQEDFEDIDQLDPMDTLNIPMQSLVINYVRGEAEVDDSGNLLYAELSATATIVDVLGNTKVIEINGYLRFSDIGTSNPTCPIPGAELLLTPDYIETNYGNGYISLFFKTNDDGSIDIDSVTTAYPGETSNKGVRSFVETSDTEITYMYEYGENEIDNE